MGTSRLPIFQKRFKALRGEMTQGQFAEKLGISRPTVGLYESGARIPDAEVLRDIADKCGVSADYLIGLTDVKAIDSDIRAVCDYTGMTAEATEAIRVMKKIYGLDIMDEFLVKEGSRFAHQLFGLNQYADYAKAKIAEMEKSDDLSGSGEVAQQLELTAFTFSEYCRHIANSFGIYDLIDKAEEMNLKLVHQRLFIFNNQEEAAEDGEHQED